jgi:hypothetical protein
MAHEFRFREVFEFLGSSGKIQDLAVRQDKFGGLTIINDSHDQLVVYVRSEQESDFYQVSLKPNQWIHIHGFNGDNYTLTVKVMPRLLSLLEDRKDIGFETLVAARFLTVMGLLPLFFSADDKADFELVISNEMAA